jgi:hypothetical protein
MYATKTENGKSKSDQYTSQAISSLFRQMYTVHVSVNGYLLHVYCACKCERLLTPTTPLQIHYNYSKIL